MSDDKDNAGDSMQVLTKTVKRVVIKRYASRSNHVYEYNGTIRGPLLIVHKDDTFVIKNDRKNDFFTFIARDGKPYPVCSYLVATEDRFGSYETSRGAAILLQDNSPEVLGLTISRMTLHMMIDQGLFPVELYKTFKYADGIKVSSLHEGSQSSIYIDNDTCPIAIWMPWFLSAYGFSVLIKASPGSLIAHLDYANKFKHTVFNEILLVHKFTFMGICNQLPKEADELSISQYLQRVDLCLSSPYTDLHDVATFIIQNRLRKILIAALMHGNGLDKGQSHRVHPTYTTKNYACNGPFNTETIMSMMRLIIGYTPRPST
jgi:hypothetical protein